MDATWADLRIEYDRRWSTWLAQIGGSVAVSTYNGGGVMVLGRRAGQPFCYVHPAVRPMAMGMDPDGGLLVSCLDRVIRYAPAAGRDGYSACYVERVAWTTGDLDLHGLDVDHAGRVLAVATGANCLAVVDARHGARPVWLPPWVDRVALEDRCHLNGVAMNDGHPAFATVVARTNTAGSWREHKTDGGQVIQVPSGEVVAEGLSMPHSPRLHEGRLWIIESGRGRVGYIEAGQFVPVVDGLPGFGRGLAFAGDYLIVGVSGPRHDPTFDGLPLDVPASRAGVFIYDARTGDLRTWATFSEPASELFDVVVLPGEQPRLVGSGDPILTMEPQIGPPADVGLVPGED